MKKLTLEETKSLLRAWRELKDKDALEVLMVSNEGLVVYLLRKYLGRGLTFEELLSAGNEGLLRGINKFDYNESMNKFSSYIGIAIENQILQEFRKYNKHSHVLSFEQPIGRDKNGDEMTIEDIVGTDAEQLIEDVITNMKLDIVREALKCLTSREQQIILLRYGLEEESRKTQKEVADLLGITQAQICRIEQKALVKMRHPKNTKKLKDFID